MWIAGVETHPQAGMTLVGMGDESAQIVYDVPEGPDELVEPVDPFAGLSVEFGEASADEPVPAE